ncbi:type VI secretion system protein TssL [Escherichia coli]|nr:type VI secretion system protein TssL [Escherichia coli]QMD40290.1 type VI secretion system protein TssL [Escherichia coli]QMK38279.1 type VI secretion system protein TssL [Escherichia coli]QMK42932.1 type VI secretion system protein TssL [Escherichia coli]QMK51822.1 type VI secretion system protein TssL [Escherichia coli]
MTDEILTPPAVNTLSFQPSVGGTKPPDHDIQDSLRGEDIKVVVEDGPDLKLRLAEITAAVNPLLAAASPLLCALAQMPCELSPGFVEHYRVLLEREVRRYQTLCDQANLRREHVLAVRYCLCTALDEAANNTVWGRRGVWAGKSLLVTFHGESEGGIKLFQIIGRLAASFQEHSDVLEIIYHILGLGFEGRYSVRPDGRKQLDDIRQQLLTQLVQRRDPITPTLSPGFTGAVSGRMRRMRRMPVWLSAGIALMVMLTVFGLYSHRMNLVTETVQQHIDAIGKHLPPPPVPVHKLRLKILLANEIARGLLTVEEDDHHSWVVFRGDTMFVPGQKTVNDTLRPVIDKAAREIARVGGAVTVTGHTDSQPIHSAEFPSNQVLSEKRATEVASLLTSGGVPASRIRVVGKGDTVPVADNRTKTGRAQNRRVEILVVEP